MYGICTNFVIFYLNVWLIANFEKINRIRKEIENKKKNKKKHKYICTQFYYRYNIIYWYF